MGRNWVDAVNGCCSMHTLNCQKHTCTESVQERGRDAQASSVAQTSSALAASAAANQSLVHRRAACVYRMNSTSCATKTRICGVRGTHAELWHGEKSLRKLCMQLAVNTSTSPFGTQERSLMLCQVLKRASMRRRKDVISVGIYRNGSNLQLEHLNVERMDNFTSSILSLNIEKAQIHLFVCAVGQRVGQKVEAGAVNERVPGVCVCCAGAGGVQDQGHAFCFAAVCSEPCLGGVALPSLFQASTLLQ